MQERFINKEKEYRTNIREMLKIKIISKGFENKLLLMKDFIRILVHNSKFYFAKKS